MTTRSEDKDVVSCGTECFQAAGAAKALVDLADLETELQIETKIVLGHFLMDSGESSIIFQLSSAKHSMKGYKKGISCSS